MTMSGGCYGSSLLAAIGHRQRLRRRPGPLSDHDPGGCRGARGRRWSWPRASPIPSASATSPELLAVAPVELVDGQDLFWWGVRTPAAMARLRERLAGWAIGS